MTLFKQVSLFSNKAGINEGPVFKIQLLHNYDKISIKYTENVQRKCTFESCQSVKKVSRSWAMTLHYIYLHDKT